MINLLLVIGCVLGVIGGAAPFERRVADIRLNWLLTGIGALFLLAGFFVRRSRSAHADAADAKGAPTVATARDAIARVADDVRALLARAATLPIEQLAREIDALIERDVFPVLEAQSTLVAQQGNRRYAAHTGPWAGGERMLYRAWSAATDGHRPEAIASLREAIPHFEEAKTRWDSPG